MGSMSSSMMMGSSAMSRPNESMGPDVLCMGPACRRGGEEGGDEGSVRSWYSFRGRGGCIGSGDAQGGDKGRKRTRAILLLVSGGIGGGTRIEGAESDRVAWSVRMRLSSAELTLTTGLSSASFSESEASRSVMIIPAVLVRKRWETGEEGSRREERTIFLGLVPRPLAVHPDIVVCLDVVDVACAAPAGCRICARG